MAINRILQYFNTAGQTSRTIAPEIKEKPGIIVKQIF